MGIKSQIIIAAAMAVAVSTVPASAAFVAYNDSSGANSGASVNANATFHGSGGNANSGTLPQLSIVGLPSALKDITTGQPLPSAKVAVSYTSGTANSNGFQNISSTINFASGTQAHQLFNGSVAFNTGAGESIELGTGGSHTYTFSSLDGTGAQQYDFAGTAIRGNGLNRWTLVTLLGADSFTNASTPAGTYVIWGNGTNGLGTNQVVINPGRNGTSVDNVNQGSVVRFTNILPGADGEFQIVSQLFTGTTELLAFASDSNKSHAIAGIRLEESAVPEPTALGLVGAAGLMVLRRRRA